MVLVVLVSISAPVPDVVVEPTWPLKAASFFAQATFTCHFYDFEGIALI